PKLENVVRFTDLDGQSVSEWRPSQEPEFRGTLSGHPEYGTPLPFSADHRSTKAYFTYESVATPPQTLTIDLRQSPPPVTTLQSGEPVPFDGSRVRYALEWYQSRDDTAIPIQLVTRSENNNPAFVYLYYYGAVGAVTLPNWNTTFQMILELGGMVAIANVRGGGELGVKWQAPFKLDRTKTLED